MHDPIRILDIAQSDWVALRDRLAGQGWTLEKGGGLDHAWATLTRGELLIEMDYDCWFEGEIAYARAQARAIEAVLPAPVLAKRLHDNPL